MANQALIVRRLPQASRVDMRPGCIEQRAWSDRGRPSANVIVRSTETFLVNQVATEKNYIDIAQIN